MTNRDFDQSDGRVLAEFAGLDILNEPGSYIFVKVPDEYGGGSDIFYPWDWKANQWQIQSLLDAVREEGLEEEFGRKLHHEVGCGEISKVEYDAYDKTRAPWAETNYDVLTEIASAPPEAICQSILELEGE